MEAYVEPLLLWWPISFGGELASRHWKESDQCRSPMKSRDGNRSGGESEELQSAEGTKSLDQVAKERAEEASEETSANNTVTSN